MDRTTRDRDPWGVNESRLTYETSSEFEAWIDDVFERVRQELGGEPKQRGDQRHYAAGGFCFAANGETGDAFFCVDHPDTAAKKAWLLTIEWRAYQPARVADRLIDAYRILERTTYLNGAIRSAANMRSFAPKIDLRNPP